MDLVEEHPDWPWDWHRLSKNLNITPEFIEKHKDKIDWDGLSLNLAISVEKHPNWPWNREKVSQRHYVVHFSQEILPTILEKQTFDLIRRYPGWPWDWKRLSQAPLDIIQKNPDKPWDWDELSANPNLTEKFILQYAGRWNVAKLSRNQAVTFDLVQKHPNWPWDWTALSHNYNITFDLIEQLSDKPWDWHFLSETVGQPLRSHGHIHFLRKKQQVVSPLKNNYLSKIYLGSPVTENIAYFPQQLKLTLPLPFEVVYEISFLIYFQN